MQKVALISQFMHSHQSNHTNSKTTFRNCQKFFNHFQNQPPEVFHKKAFLKHFVIFTGKHLHGGLFFNKIAGHQSCNFIKKGLLHRYFLVNTGKFIITPILKNIQERLHFWKVLCENIFLIGTQQRELLMKKNGHLLCERLLKLVKIEQKCCLS